MGDIRIETNRETGAKRLVMTMTAEEARQMADDLGAGAPPAPSEPPTRGPKTPMPPVPPEWSTRDGKILRYGEPFQVRGISWFGFETNDHQLHGLWTGGSSVEGFLDQIKALGFNALRIPISPEILSWDTRSNANWGGGGVARTNFLNLLIDAAERDLAVLIDLHNTASWRGLIGKLDPPRYGQREWLETLRELARIAKNNPVVMGIDLLNEPHDLTWDEWAALAEEAGNAIHEVNRDLLVFVEGVGNKGVSDPNPYFWGENLSRAALRPVRFKVPNRLVLSPHVYGPSVAKQEYFKRERGFPGNLAKIWWGHFGAMTAEQDAPLVIGEWGGRYEGDDKIWGDEFVRWTRERGLTSNFFWCLNPNSGDTGGILKDDWRTVDQDKMALVRRSWGQ